MENLTTAISVQVNSKDKELATNILKGLGLNMSTYVNMAIKQLIYYDGVPFDVVNPKPTRELKKALKEGEKIMNGRIEKKGYYDANQMIKDILANEN